MSVKTRELVRCPARHRSDEKKMSSSFWKQGFQTEALFGQVPVIGK